MKTVTDRDLDNFVNKRIEACRMIMSDRAGEYATVDRMYNFKRAAQITGSTLTEAVRGMMMKHLVSVLDFSEMRRDFNRTQLSEKFTDLHNYLYFLELAIVMEKEEEARIKISREAVNKAAAKAAEAYQKIEETPIAAAENED